MGAKAYRLLEGLRPDPGYLIEVGSERGEGSTRWLYRYAKQHGLRFLTVDPDPKQVERADRIAPGKARQATGVEALRRLRTPVSVAYLDGFDWTPEGYDRSYWIARYRARYRRMGIDLNNRNCQQEHLAEAELVADKATDNCMVICDDSWWDETQGMWDGKGGLAVPYLVSQGFSVVGYDGPANKSLGFAFLTRG